MQERINRGIRIPAAPIFDSNCNPGRGPAAGFIPVREGQQALGLADRRVRCTFRITVRADASNGPGEGVRGIRLR